MTIVVAIHDPPVWSIPETQVNRIARTLPDDEVVDARDGAQRQREIARADALFATRLTADECANASRLRWVQSSAVGVGTLLVPGLINSAIVVTNSRGIHSGAIAEHALALILALQRRLHVAIRRQASREWAQVEIAAHSTRPLHQSSLLVIGLGTIGARVATVAGALGMRVTAVRRRVGGPAPPIVHEVFSPNQLTRALGDADVVVVTAPSTPDTKALIGRAEFEAMKPTAILVNVSRGEVIDEAALVHALETGQIAGAGLDAFLQEPLPADHPLWQLPNVVISPHTASFSGDYWTPVVDLFLENVGRFKRGEALRNIVDKVLGY